MPTITPSSQGSAAHEHPHPHPHGHGHGDDHIHGDDDGHGPHRESRSRFLGPAAAVIGISVVLVALGYFVRSEGPESAPYAEFTLSDAADVTTPPLPATTGSGITLADNATQQTIDRLQASTAASATSGQLGLLARLLLQRAAVTGDATAYTRALATLDRAVALAPNNLDIRAQRASARITTHEFIAAGRDAERVLASNPDHPGGLAAGFDAALETGNISLAQRHLARLVRLAPESPQVLYRQSRWAELNGNTAQAAAFASQARIAAEDAGLVGTSRASYELLAGKLAIDEGNYPIAISAYEAALVAAPGWHAALAGLGRAQAAAGDLRSAEQSLSKSSDALPLPDTLSSLGDVRTALGDIAGAKVAYGTVDVVAQLESVHQLFNRAIVVSQADRGINTASAVRDARAELKTRKDVYGYDALAWALLANGQPKQAVQFADASLALGTKDPRLLAHAGLVYAAAGEVTKAKASLTRALELSPSFEPVLVERAKVALSQLNAGVAA
ncbi:MAG: hypothetical protein Q7K25_06475 [Actinomycetota bacterium]|nr:hypothetical protein [Actinomycetota bacterium]